MGTMDPRDVPSRESASPTRHRRMASASGRWHARRRITACTGPTGQSADKRETSPALDPAANGRRFKGIHRIANLHLTVVLIKGRSPLRAAGVRRKSRSGWLPSGSSASPADGTVKTVFGDQGGRRNSDPARGSPSARARNPSARGRAPLVLSQSWGWNSRQDAVRPL